MSAIDTLKRALAVDQTIEPTEIAGFNQFYDDFNGTQIRQYGLGLDFGQTPNFHAGVEFLRRNLTVPTLVFDPVTQNLSNIFTSAREVRTRAYLYWAPATSWSVNADFGIEDVRSERFDPSDVRPTSVRTFTAPISLRYTRGDGFFVALTPTYLRQSVGRLPGVSVVGGTESVLLVDGAVGYRFPARKGFFSLEAKNLGDRHFSIEDDSYRSSRTTLARFLPQRTLLLKLNLTF